MTDIPYKDRYPDFSVLEGKTLTEVKGGRFDDELVFKCSDGTEYLMYHRQDCCESVTIEEIVGDLEDLIGTPVVLATKTTNSGDVGDYGDSETWTFFNLSTLKGSVTIRWYGTSNGYYSEDADFERIK